MYSTADYRFTMTTCDMPKAHSEDLCWGTVWLHLILRFSYAEIMELLYMCEKTVKRDIDMFNSTGQLSKVITPKDCLLKLNVQTIVLQSVLYQRGVSLHEVQMYFFVQLETMCMFQPLICFTRQKIQVIAVQQSA